MFLRLAENTFSGIIKILIGNVKIRNNYFLSIVLSFISEIKIQYEAGMRRLNKKLFNVSIFYIFRIKGIPAPNLTYSR